MAKGRKTGGRQKGAANKLSADLREMILGALNTAGGAAYLVKQATNNPQAFIGLLGKIVPKDVNLRTPDGLTLSIQLSTCRKTTST